MTRSRFTRLPVCLSALLILATAGTSIAQTPQPTPLGTIDSALKNDKSDFLVRSEVNHFSREYQDGDSLSVRVISEAAAYLYVFYQQADGKVFMIFPNRIQTRNHVDAGQWVAIPWDNDLFRWRIAPPFGKELIKVVASRKPIASLTAQAPGGGRFAPVGPKRVEDAARDLAKQASRDWAEQSTPITTAAATPGGPPRTGRRFAVIIGVSENKYDDMVERAFKGTEDPPDLRALPSCANDARIMSGIFSDLGRLDDQRVLVGAQATRANIEAAITKWLPSISKPGDTIFIYHSGHGGQIDDDNGDEEQTDKKDEYLLPYDFAGLDTLVAARRLEQADVYKTLMALAGGGSWPTNQREAEAWQPRVRSALVRNTGITDDQFGRWLQNLDGRQVIVILDICHSGGFATHEKAVPGVDGGALFNFLDRELSRLKDIGQRDTALLAACRTSDSSQAVVFKSKDSLLRVSAMTYFLAVPIVNSTGPFELADAYDACKTGMKTYFASKEFQEVRAEAAKHKKSINPHEPLLYSDLTHAAFLRP